MAYSGKRSVAETAVAPLLGAPGASGIYFTDLRSLVGLVGPADFVRRLGLAASVQLEAQMHGCAIVEFRLPPQAIAVTPTHAPGASAGLRVAGAREWLLMGNLPLAPGMVSTVVYSTSTGHRWARIQL